MELIYAVVTPDGALVDICESEAKAISSARKVANGGGVGLRVTDSTHDPRYTNPPGKYADMPYRAMELSRLPVLTESEVMNYSPEEAFEQFRDIWPTNSGTYASVNALIPRLSLRRGKKGGRQSGNPQNMFRDNTKMRKEATQALGLDYDLEGLGLSFSPHTTPYRDTANDNEQYVPWDGGGRIPNLCAGASKECIKACLIATGQNIKSGKDWNFNPLSNKPPWQGYNFGLKVKYTQALHRNPAAFVRLMIAALRAQERDNAQYEMFEMMYRLNVYSDIPWEIFTPFLFEMFSETAFFDYTKVPARETPPNYHLTFSFSGFNKPWCMEEMSRGRGITVVFMTYPGVAPTTAAARREIKAQSTRARPIAIGKTELYPVNSFWGAPVVSGDMYDLRPLDGTALSRIGQNPNGGHVVWLDYKLPTNRDHTGTVRAKELGSFVVDAFYDAETGTVLAPETPSETRMV